MTAIMMKILILFFRNFLIGMMFMISFLIISREKRRVITGISIFAVTLLISMCFWDKLTLSYEAKRSGLGLILYIVFLWLLPFMIQVIVNKKLKRSYSATSAKVLIICLISAGLGGLLSYTILLREDELGNNLAALLIVVLLSYSLRLIDDKLYTTGKKGPRFFYPSMFVFVILLSISLILLWMYNYVNMKLSVVTITVVISFLLLMGLFAVFTIHYRKYIEESYKKELMEKEMTNIIQSARLVEASYEKLRTFRHDYKNILLSLSIEDDNEGMNLLRKWESRFSATDSQYENVMLKMMKIKNLSVRSLVSSKVILFIDEGVSTDISIIGEIQELHMEEFDLIRILGIFLDNAFEEAKCTESRQIRMGIISEDESITIIIENSCRVSTPSPECVIKKGFTTKGEGRGIGLSNVSDIMRSYKKCSFQLGKREKTVFFVELTLCSNCNI